MKEEIKEILDKLKDDNWYDELDLTGTMWIELTWEETHLLLDYITNLQEENERLKEEIIKLYKKDSKIINKLKEELKIIQEKWDKDKQFDKCRTMELLDYKQRNEKAIYKLQDIIESNNGALSNSEHLIIGKHSLLKLENDNCYILLNILKGDEDDN